MTVALRAHHLLCVITYVGKGYNADFVVNFNEIAARLAAGEPVHLVAGPDAICAPLCRSEDEPHCLGNSTASRDAKAVQDLAPLLEPTLSPGASFVLDGPLLQRLRRAFAQSAVRRACQGCQWHDLCSEVAHDDYRGALL